MSSIVSRWCPKRWLDCCAHWGHPSSSWLQVHAQHLWWYEASCVDILYSVHANLVYTWIWSLSSVICVCMVWSCDDIVMKFIWYLCIYLSISISIYRLVVIDHVTSNTAIVLPIQRITSLCKERGIPILIDGAHGLLNQPLDLTALGADFYVRHIMYIHIYINCCIMYILPLSRIQHARYTRAKTCLDPPSCPYLWVGFPCLIYDRQYIYIYIYRFLHIYLNLWQVGNCHKWLSAPKGTAFLYVSPTLQSRIRPRVQSHGLHDGFQSNFLWTGLQDYSALLAIPACLRFWQHHDDHVAFDTVRQYSHTLAATAANELDREWHRTMEVRCIET